MAIKIIKTANFYEMSQFASERIIVAIAKNPFIVLGLATGSTPDGVYNKLIKAFRQKRISFQKATTFNLDEYYPISPSHRQSYYDFMQKKLIRHIDLPLKNFNILNGLTKNPQDECASYEEKIIQAGGIDLQILGIGSNGHIAFNEPGSKKISVTRKVKLSPQTIKDNSRFFNKKTDVPKFALTMGIATILKAKEVILLASGENKAQAIQNALRNIPSPNVPASFLQHHKNSTFVIDKKAAKLL